MSVMDVIVVFFVNIGKLFAAPFTNPQMLWIIIPVYLNWLFTEFYQEKKGTSFGNAITNGFVALWVGIDWTRTTVDLLLDKTIKSGGGFVKIGVALLMGIYGIFIVWFGIKGSKAIKVLGRIREVTYLTIMLTPIFYGVVEASFEVILSIIMFFPIFYFIVELLDWVIPDPKVYEEEKKKEFEMPLPAIEPLPSATRVQQPQQHSYYNPGFGQQRQYPSQYPRQNQYGQQYPSQYPQQNPYSKQNQYGQQFRR